MANERDIAILTDQIAQAMNRARATLDNVAHSLSGPEFDRLLVRRLEDVESLDVGARRVEMAEQEAAETGRVAQGSEDRYSMERWSDADTQVRRSFGSAQADAGDLASRIGAAQRELTEFHDDLGRSTAYLDQALRDVDALEQFPEYGRSEASEGLRDRLQHLRGLTTGADAGLKVAFDRLDSARRTASEFEMQTHAVGEGRHSAAVRDTSNALRQDLQGTRAGIADVREGIDARMYDVHASAQYGVDEAIRMAELANAVRAGTNPTQHTEQTGDRAADQQAGSNGGNGVQDPRLRLMRGAPETTQER
ncbi:hypothetical protein [Kribbella sp. NPDC048915]|uniref:hypothetical protein n=1 Tax=Kribbella sp. NPDC048915 TaxID=3155148 RepID=UPI0033EA342C